MGGELVGAPGTSRGEELGYLVDADAFGFGGGDVKGGFGEEEGGGVVHYVELCFVQSNGEILLLLLLFGTCCCICTSCGSGRRKKGVEEKEDRGFVEIGYFTLNVKFYGA